MLMNSQKLLNISYPTNYVLFLKEKQVKGKERKGKGREKEEGRKEKRKEGRKTDRQANPDDRETKSHLHVHLLLVLQFWDFCMVCSLSLRQYTKKQKVSHILQHSGRIFPVSI